MKQNFLISIFCADQTGLVAAIANRLFELGGNLGDTAFSVLGTGAEFTTVCELPNTIDIDELGQELRQLEQLSKAEISIPPFTLDAIHGPRGHVTHRITIQGGDQPGLIARLCETFIEFNTNIVRLSAEVTEQHEYALRLSVNIPPEKVTSCLATVSNTAEGLQLSCRFEAV